MKGRLQFLIWVLICFTAGGGDFCREVNAAAKPARKHRKSGHQPKRVANPTSPERYLVRPGDTLYSIARARNTTPEALRLANGLRNNTIHVGQKLKARAAQRAAKASAAPPQRITPPAVPDIGKPAVERVDAPAPTSADEPPRIQLVKAGIGFLGTRYRRQGDSARTGFDCSGFVQNLFSYFNIELPRSSREQFKIGENVDKKDLAPGDLVFFSSGGKVPTHVGVYIGDNQFVHAARKAHQVIVSDINQSWYVKRFLGARRMLELWWDGLGNAHSSTD